MADGELLVAATFDTGTLLLHPDDLRVIAGPLGADNAVMGVSVDESGAELAVAASSRVDRWQVFPGRAPVALEPVGGGATATYRGLDELVTGGLDGSVTAWQLRPDVPGLISLDELGPGNPRLDPTGRVLAMWGFGAGVRLFDAGTLQPLSTLPFDDPEHTSFSGVAFNSDGSRIATAWCTGPSHVFAEPCDGWVGVYDVATGDPVIRSDADRPARPWVGSAIAWSSRRRLAGHRPHRRFGRDPARRRPSRRDHALDLAASGDGFVTEVDFTDASAPQPLLVATVGYRRGDLVGARTWERLGRSRSVSPHTSHRTGGYSPATRTAPSGCAMRSCPSWTPTVDFRSPSSGPGSARTALDSSPSTISPARPGSGAPTHSRRSAGPSRWRVAPAGSRLSPDGTRLLVGGERVWELRLDPDRWEEQACLAAGRNLTQGEWRTHLGDEPYRRTCPQFSAGD
jgi:WD40 repeat protein